MSNWNMAGVVLLVACGSFLVFLALSGELDFLVFTADGRRGPFFWLAWRVEAVWRWLTLPPVRCSWCGRRMRWGLPWRRRSDGICPACFAREMKKSEDTR